MRDELRRRGKSYVWLSADAIRNQSLLSKQRRNLWIDLHVKFCAEFIPFCYFDELAITSYLKLSLKVK